MNLSYFLIILTGISVSQLSYTRSPPATYGKSEDEIDPEIVGNIQSKNNFIFLVKCLNIMIQIIVLFDISMY